VRDVSSDRWLGDGELAGEEWPSCWEAVLASTRSEMIVATVLRNVWGVTQWRPVSLRICRQRRSALGAPFR
jgi:hypothetical protein